MAAGKGVEMGCGASHGGSPSAARREKEEERTPGYPPPDVLRSCPATNPSGISPRKRDGRLREVEPYSVRLRALRMVSAVLARVMAT